MTTDHRYLEPGRSAAVFNSAVAWLARMGVSLLGSRELRVRGRRSGEWRTTPVNLLVVNGRRYLVAPRGQTQWVRNIRAAGGGELRLGRRIEPFRAVEVADQHVHRAPTAPSEIDPGISPDIDSIVLTALDKSPLNRYQTAAQMRTELSRALAAHRIRTAARSETADQPGSAVARCLEVTQAASGCRTRTELPSPQRLT